MSDRPETRAEVAHRVRECARRHDIPIEEDPELLQDLVPLRTGPDVSPQAYAAVAGVLALLARLNGPQPESQA